MTREPPNLFESQIGVSDRYGEITHKYSSKPERRLMLAVLENAISTYEKHVFSHKAIFFEVERWFFDSQGKDLFSFNSICQVLELNRRLIHRQLLARKTLAPAQSCDLTLNHNIKKRQPYRNISGVHSVVSAQGSNARDACE